MADTKSGGRRAGDPGLVEVRRAGPADVEVWSRFRVAMLREIEPGDPMAQRAELAPLIAGWLRERLDSPAFGAFVAEIDGETVGSGGISIYDVPPGPGPATREAYVMSMYTLPSHRGRGVARALVEALMGFARAAGVDRVWLRASSAGRPVYLAAGFEPRDYYLHRHVDR